MASKKYQQLSQVGEWSEQQWMLARTKVDCMAVPSNHCLHSVIASELQRSLWHILEDIGTIASEVRLVCSLTCHQPETLLATHLHLTAEF